MYKRDKRINGERAWHLSSGCVSPGPSACVSQGVWDCLVMNNMNTIPGPSSHMNTTNGRTMNTLPVTGDQVGDYLWNQFRVTEFSGTKMEWTLDFIHISVAFILYFFYSAGRGGQQGDTRPIMEFLSSWLNPQLCSHFKPLPSFDRCHQEEPLMKLKQTRRGCCLTPPLTCV